MVCQRGGGICQRGEHELDGEGFAGGGGREAGDVHVYGRKTFIGGLVVRLEVVVRGLEYER